LRGRRAVLIHGGWWRVVVRRLRATPSVDVLPRASPSRDPLCRSPCVTLGHIASFVKSDDAARIVLRECAPSGVVDIRVRGWDWTYRPGEADLPKTGKGCLLKRIALLIAVLALVVTASGTALASQSQTGNGAPSGQHYNLGLIGYANGDTVKNSNGNDSAGNVIHVPLSGPCRILLTLNPTFDIFDNNCTDGLSEFGLPAPTSGGSFISGYSVFARALTPGGHADMSSCFTDASGTWCNAGIVLQKDLNDGKFTNVSKDLLTVCVNGSNEPIFTDQLKDYFWQYDNTGLRNAQLRFYNGISTDLSGSCTAHSITL